MIDPIDRQAAIKAAERFIKDCNPEHFVGHPNFIEYMDSVGIQSFGNWQYANGFNMGLTAAEVAIKNLPSAQPEQKWIPCTERLPEKNGTYLCSERYFMYVDDFKNGEWQLTNMAYAKPIAWMPLPEPYKEENR